MKSKIGIDMQYIKYKTFTKCENERKRELSYIYIVKERPPLMHLHPHKPKFTILGKNVSYTSFLPFSLFPLLPPNFLSHTSTDHHGQNRCCGSGGGGCVRPCGRSLARSPLSSAVRLCCGRGPVPAHIIRVFSCGLYVS